MDSVGFSWVHLGLGKNRPNLVMPVMHHVAASVAVLSQFGSGQVQHILDAVYPRVLFRLGVLRLPIGFRWLFWDSFWIG